MADASSASREHLVALMQSRGMTVDDIFEEKVTLSVAEFVKVLEVRAQLQKTSIAYDVLRIIGVEPGRDASVPRDAFELIWNETAIIQESQESQESQEQKDEILKREKREKHSRTEKDRDDETGPIHSEEARTVIESPLLGGIASGDVFVFMLELSPAMEATIMMFGQPISRLDYARNELLLVLEELRHSQLTSWFNIIVFGSAHTLLKLQHRSVPVTEKSIQEARDFLIGLKTEKTRRKNSKVGSKAFIKALQDVSLQDDASNVFVLCSMDSEHETALKTLGPECAQKTKLGWNRSTAPKIKSIRRGTGPLRLFFGILGPCADNSEATLSALSAICNTTRRWITEDGELVLLPPPNRQVDQNKPTRPTRPRTAPPSRRRTLQRKSSSNKNKKKMRTNSARKSEALSTTENQERAYWWAKKRSGRKSSKSTEARLRKVFLLLCKSMTGLAKPFEQVYSSFDANNDGVISVSDFLSTVRIILKRSKTSSKALCLTRLEEYRLWRCLVRDETSSISLHSFCGFFFGCFKFFGMPPPEFTSSLVEASAHAEWKRYMSEMEPDVHQSHPIHSISSEQVVQAIDKQTALLGQDDTESTSESSSSDIDEQEEEQEEDQDDDDVDESEDEEDDDDDDETDQEREDGSLVPITGKQNTGGLLKGLPCSAAQYLGLGPFFQNEMQVKLIDKGEIKLWNALCSRYRDEKNLQALGAIQKRIASQHTSCGVSQALFKVLQGAALYLPNGKLQAPYLLRSFSARENSSDVALDDPRFRVTNPTVRNAIDSIQPRESQGYGQAGEFFATFHPLDMNEWLEHGIPELSVTSPIVDQSTKAFGGCSNSPANDWCSTSGVNPILSGPFRILVKARKLLGHRIRCNQTSEEDEIINVVAHPRRDITDRTSPVFTVLLETAKGKTYDLSTSDRRSLWLQVPVHSCGASDGENFVSPGSWMPLARYWGDLCCYSAGVSAASIPLSATLASQSSRYSCQDLTLELAEYVPFPHEVNMEQNTVRIDGENPGEESWVGWQDAQVQSLRKIRYRAVSIRSDIDKEDSRVQVFQIDSDSVPPVLEKLAETKSMVIRLLSDSLQESIVLVELPLEWISHSDAGTPQLMEIGQEILDYAKSAAKCVTDSGNICVSLPCVELDTHFLPLPELPGTRMRTTMALSRAGVFWKSYCAGAWQLERMDTPLAQSDETFLAATDTLDIHSTKHSDWKAHNTGSRIEETVLFSRPFLCIVERKGRALGCCYIGKDSWVRVPESHLEKKNPSLTVDTNNLPLAVHHRIRSPTKQFRTTVPCKDGRVASKNNNIINNNKGYEQQKKLRRVPDGTSTQTMCVLLLEAIQESIEVNAPGSSLGDFFDAFCDAHIATRKDVHPPPRHGLDTSQAQFKLDRKSLERGLRRTLGLRVPWSVFNALFAKLSRGKELIHKHDFLATFEELDRKMHKPCEKASAHWVREALYDIADAMMFQDKCPWEAFSPGTSFAEVMRFIEELGTRLTKPQLYQLIGSIERDGNGKLTSSELFDTLMLSVYLERLGDLAALKLNSSCDPNRLEAIDLQMRYIERVIREYKRAAFAKRVHQAPFTTPGLDSQLISLIREQGIIRRLEKELSSTSKNRISQVETDKLHKKLDSSRKKLERISEVVKHAITAEQEVVLTDGQASHQCMAVLAEISSPWVHTGIYGKIVEDCFSSQSPLKEAGVFGRKTSIMLHLSMIPCQERESRLKQVLSRVEHNIEIVRAKEMQRSQKLIAPVTVVSRPETTPVLQLGWEEILAGTFRVERTPQRPATARPTGRAQEDARRFFQDSTANFQIVETVLDMSSDEDEYEYEEDNQDLLQDDFESLSGGSYNSDEDKGNEKDEKQQDDDQQVEEDEEDGGSFMSDIDASVKSESIEFPEKVQSPEESSDGSWDEGSVSKQNNQEEGDSDHYDDDFVD